MAIVAIRILAWLALILKSHWKVGAGQRQGVRFPQTVLILPYARLLWRLPHDQYWMRLAGASCFQSPLDTHHARISLHLGILQKDREPCREP